MNKTSQTSQKEIMMAILLAGALISGSLVFLGFQLRPAPAPQVTIDEAQLADTIKQNLPAELKSGALLEDVKQAVLTSLQQEDALAGHIDEGIQRFIQQQQDAQRKAQEGRQRQAEEQAKNVRKVSPEQDHIFGNPHATISLIEYSDFECPFCKSFHATPKKVVEAYNGNVNWVYRHYPLQFHNPGAQKQAEASECANELGGNDAFWTYVDLIYERTTSNGQGFPIEQLVPLAEEIGLDREQFHACLNSGKYAECVNADLTEGTNSGISGTPGAILLNNATGDVKLVSGAVPFEAFTSIIDNMLK